MESKQTGFLNNRGQVAGEIITINRETDLNNTFVTDRQKEIALELIKTGKAANADEAREIMRKEEVEDNLDAYTLKK